MSRYFTKPNLFTPLIVIAAFAFAFRLANIVTYRGTPAGKVGIVMSASAVENPEPSKEEPPPISQADLSKTVKDSATAPGEGKPAEDKPGEGKPGEAGPKDAAAAQPSVPAPPEQAASYSTSEIEILQSLAKRRDEIDAREKTLGEREALLKAAEQEVDRKISELGKLKADMEKLLGQQQKEEEGRIGSLVKIYENMKPADAARIFDQLDMNILLDVVGRMNERKVSPVLANMNPEKAKDITVRLAEQRKLPAAAAAAAKTPAPAK